MKELLFNTPWWLPTIIALVGIGLFVYGNKRVDTTLRVVGVIVFVLALSVVLVSWLVDTDVERVEHRTRQLVDAVKEKDWKTFGSLLDKRTHFALYRNRDDLVAGASATADRIGFKSARVTSLTARQDDTVITVDIEVISEQDMPPYPVPSNWRLTWQETADGWFLNQIDVLPSRTLKPDQVTNELVRPPAR